MTDILALARDARAITGEDWGSARQLAAANAFAAAISGMTPAQLNDWYESTVGYRPQVDDPSMSDDDLRALCKEYAAEVAANV